MALSSTAARALEQVTMGLFMLRGADYFTEEEWIKIDGLIHKGKYVFTNGPQWSNVADEALITFDETNSTEKTDFQVQIPPMTSFPTIKEETAMPSPPLSDPADSTEAETPNTTSAEASSDDEPSVPASAESKSASNESVNIPKREPMQKQANGGLAFYTQAQLDEVKAFNSGLTKAGQKPGRKGSGTKHSHRAEEAYPSPAYSQKEVSEPTARPSPAPSEQATHSQIQSWADEVQDIADAAAAQEIVAPAPTKGWATTPSTEVNPLVEAFRKEKGRDPKNMNEVVQPKNLEFRPLTARPFSRVSHRSSAKSAAPVPAPIPNAPLGSSRPKLNVSPGTILVAQRGSACQGGKGKAPTIRIAIKAGDRIKVLKHVSGITHLGTNLRTMETGQFSEEIFKKAPAMTAEDLIRQQREVAARTVSGTVGVIGNATVHGRNMSLSTISNGLDRLEGTNAAEWDEVGSVTNVNTPMSVVVKSKTSAPAAQAAAPKPIGGLGASRFAALADEDESVNSGSDTPDFHGMSKEEVGQLIDDKIAQILAAQRHASASAPAPTPPPMGRRSKAPINEPLKPVIPKKETCWFWKTGKGCRFTADECRDLHALIPSSDPTNLRMGKPSWGAIADFVPSTSSSSIPVSVSVQSDETTPGPNGQANIGPVKSLTCWYWQNDEKGCQNSAEECKYLHKKCEGGVANKPNSWKRPSWNRFATPTTGEKVTGCAWTINGDAETDAGGDGDGDNGELVLEEIMEGESANSRAAEGLTSLANWGGDDKYKPPHIKALEEKALVEATGW
ncbi:hypothetical protein BDZ45DRAFT_751580 [Acephala macrosclerotiorum]|nr:hypothetical protein BDZ45DRAFT_751580 [Acephala macrosclerotiorum]